MILVNFNKAINENFISKYKDHINIIDFISFKGLENWPVNIIEEIKKSEATFDITIIDYMQEILLCLDALNIIYNIVYIDLTNIPKEISEDYIYIRTCNAPKIILDSIDDIDLKLKGSFSWIDDKSIEVLDENKLSEIPINKNKLTLEQLLDENIEITETDVRELKATQNKLKVGMLLQAKNSLNRVLKLSNILDKLYDKLIERIDNGLDTTDTASLMYTTEYIAKALSETNQFIVSLISNEKIQNFFIIDNSSVINVNGNDRVDINSREKIRKAAEIVLENIDYFANGEFQNLRNPNIIEISEEPINNADNKS